MFLNVHNLLPTQTNSYLLFMNIQIIKLPKFFNENVNLNIIALLKFNMNVK